MYQNYFCDGKGSFSHGSVWVMGNRQIISISMNEVSFRKTWIGQKYSYLEITSLCRRPCKDSRVHLTTSGNNQHSYNSNQIHFLNEHNLVIVKVNPWTFHWLYDRLYGHQLIFCSYQRLDGAIHKTFLF